MTLPTINQYCMKVLVPKFEDYPSTAMKNKLEQINKYRDCEALHPKDRARLVRALRGRAKRLPDYADGLEQP